MTKKNKTPDDSWHKEYSTISENVVENEKYIKMLDLQRLVLTKIINTEFVQSCENEIADIDNPESNSSSPNK